MKLGICERIRCEVCDGAVQCRAVPRERLDKLLVDRGLVASRERARALVMSGVVLVRGHAETKPGTMLDPSVEITLKEADHPYVSRGALKLVKGLDAFGIEQSIRNVLLVQVTQSLATLVPISPCGIGTEQAFIVYVFKGTGIGSANLLAFSVGMKLTLITTNVILGFGALFLTLGHVDWRSLTGKTPAAEGSARGVVMMSSQAVVQGHFATRASERRAASTTDSAVNPNFSNRVS